MVVKSNFIKRVLSALVLIPLFLGVILLGFPYVHIAGLFVIGLCAYEWFDILGTKNPRHSAFLFGPLIVSFLLYMFTEMTTAFVFALAFALFVFIYGKRQKVSGYLALGSLLMPLTLISLLTLYDLSVHYFLFLFLIVWTTDMNGYFVGKFLKGPKLAPTISPKKTWSGAIGGLLGAVLIAFFYPLLMLKQTPTTAIIIGALVISAASQMSDLLESKLKRQFGVKDSGSIIPGHGGVLDRMDGLLLSAISMLFLLKVYSFGK